MPQYVQILLLALIAAIVVGIGIAIIHASKQKSSDSKADNVEAPKPNQTRVAAAPPPGVGTRPPQGGLLAQGRTGTPFNTRPTGVPFTPVGAPLVAPPAPPPEPKRPGALTAEPDAAVSASDFYSAPAAPTSEIDELQDDDDGWGAGLDISDEATTAPDFEEPLRPAPISRQAPASRPTPPARPTVSFGDDDEEDGDTDDGEPGEDDVLDAFIAKELKDISRETQQAFTQAIIERDFSISKMKEADEISQKCVAAYLQDHEVPKANKMQERLFAIHPQIQVSDLPQFAESYLDDGNDDNQEIFADLEEMCDSHEESVLDLFMQFNSTLPARLKCSLVGEVKRPIRAVLFLAPEWDDSDFAKPDFGEDEEDVDENDDFYEDYYEDLDELEDEDNR